MDLEDKYILDVTCGMRGIWWQKHQRNTIYCDQRCEKHESDYGTVESHRTVDVKPDIIADFTKLPFPNDSFYLVVMDPPHLIGKDNSWIKKEYGYFDTKSQMLSTICAGIRECMRVLKPHGTFIFKWNEVHVSVREIVDCCGYTPLFGHRSGKKSQTHWLTFMKLDDEQQMSLFDE